jgi:hypothetical protein
MKQLILICFASFLGVEALAQAKLQVGSGTIVTSSENAQIVLDDTDLENDGAIEQSAGDGGFHFTGLNQTIISGSGINRFDKLLLDKRSTATLLLRSDISIAGKLHFVAGRLNLKDNRILLGTSGILDGESELTHLFSTGRGYVEAIHDGKYTSTINPGNLGAVISTSSNPGKMIVRRGHVAQLNNVTGSKSIQRYYDILPSSNSNLNATVRFRYFDNERNNIDESDFSILRSDDGMGWSDLGADAKNASGNTIEKGGINKLSRFTISTPGPGSKAIFTVWPNPVLEKVNISVPATAADNVKILIYDSKGKLVQSQQKRIGIGNNQLQVDMKSLPQGNYTMQTNWAGQTKTTRLNKM